MESKRVQGSSGQSDGKSQKNKNKMYIVGPKNQRQSFSLFLLYRRGKQTFTFRDSFNKNLRKGSKCKDQPRLTMISHLSKNSRET